LGFFGSRLEEFGVRKGLPAHSYRKIIQLRIRFMYGQSNVPSRASIFEATALPSRNALYQAARILSGSRMEAEDLVQETYLQAWKSFDTFQPGTNCGAWLFAILRNKVREYRRRWKVHSCIVSDTLTLEWLSRAAQESADRDVWAAIEGLPAHYAKPLLLALMDDLSYREIAAEMRCPIGTIMSRISRGRELLRDSLAEVAVRRGILRE
jgi:RNA polymerase sigma-70 factor (ECF subfamily)